MLKLKIFKKISDKISKKLKNNSFQQLNNLQNAFFIKDPV